MSTRYDFDDPLVRRLVERDHEPEESWSILRQGDGKGFAESSGVRCKTCTEAWPCRPIVEYRIWRSVASKLEKEGPPR